MAPIADGLEHHAENDDVEQYPEQVDTDPEHGDRLEAELPFAGGDVAQAEAAQPGRQVSGAPDADYGLIFRHDGDNYYYFQVSESSQYAVYLYSGGRWAELIGWTKAEAIRAGRINKVAVAGEGARFTLFINGAPVGTVTDATLPTGSVGVAVQIYNAGESATFEFDNFEWRAPRSAGAARWSLPMAGSRTGSPIAKEKRCASWMWRWSFAVRCRRPRTSMPRFCRLRRENTRENSPSMTVSGLSTSAPSRRDLGR